LLTLYDWETAGARPPRNYLTQALLEELEEDQEAPFYNPVESTEEEVWDPEEENNHWRQWYEESDPVDMADLDEEYRNTDYDHEIEDDWDEVQHEALDKAWSSKRFPSTLWRPTVPLEGPNWYEDPPELPDSEEEE
jgi:hypothetical protein